MSSTEHAENVQPSTTAAENLPSTVVPGSEIPSDSGKVSESVGTPNSAQQPQPKVCSFYQRNGWCGFGRNCRYTHPVRKAPRKPNPKSRKSADGENPDHDVSTTTAESRNDDNSAAAATKRSQKPRRQRRRGGKGTENSGEGGENLPPPQHQPQPLQNQDEKTTTTSMAVSSTSKPTQPQVTNRSPSGGGIVSRPVRPQTIVLTAADLGSDAQRGIIPKAGRFLQTRFPKNAVISKAEDDSTTVQLDFTSTDPDWAFDIKHISLQLVLPVGYPIETLGCRVVGPLQLPPPARHYIQQQIQQWLETQSLMAQQNDQFSCILREFIRWLDRQLQDLFVQGLRKVRLFVEAEAAGITLADPARLANASEAGSDSDGDDEEESETSDEESGDNSESDATGDFCVEIGEKSRTEPATASGQKADGGPIGTVSSALGNVLNDASYLRPGVCQIKLTSWRLGEGVASVAARRLCLLLSCQRCAQRQELSWSAASRQCQSSCTRCRTAHRLEMQPRLLHAYNSVLAEVFLANCQPIDLLLMSCELLVTCLQCSRETVFKAMNYGAEHKTWCVQCHEKLTLTIDAIRFFGKGMRTGATSGDAASGKKPKVPKAQGGPSIREGEPLPEYGACKHYKKSYRWFRFPCCGKVFPCDVCHEEAESHEMKVANRIVCGWCSHEQPYQQKKPCASCKGAVVRQRTQHWEGGKGCRNTLKMSNNDQQKFRSKNKTVSRKQQEKIDQEKGKTKKTTKLRHDDANNA